MTRTKVIAAMLLKKLNLHNICIYSPALGKVSRNAFLQPNQST